jgi:hypothetical protein
VAAVIDAVGDDVAQMRSGPRDMWRELEQLAVAIVALDHAHL